MYTLIVSPSTGFHSIFLGVFTKLLVVELPYHNLFNLTNWFSQISDGYAQIYTPIFSCEIYGIPWERVMFDSQNPGSRW